MTISLKATPPNYRKAEGRKLCKVCVQYAPGGICSAYSVFVNPKNTCESWESGEKKEVSATPTSSYAHGPGGLFSMPGLGKREKGKMVGGRYYPDMKEKMSTEYQNGEIGKVSTLDAYLKEETETGKATPMKKEADGLHPSTHYLVVVDKQKPSTWHLRVRDTDGQLSNRLMGAAQAALTVGFRGNKYQGPQKTVALAKLRRLQKEAKTTTYKPGLQHGPSIKNPRVYDALRKRGYSKQRAAMISNSMVSKRSLSVFKDAKGQWRWVALSSNAYRDRDGEIVSRKALADDVKRADKTGDYGVLRFWHMPGLDIGKADFNMLSPSGKTLIESGTFNDPYIAQQVAKKAKQYQVSIGFRHPPDEPRDGVFYNIKRFERSLVPAGRAANPFTSLQVKEKGHMSDNTFKVRQFKALLENDDLANQMLEQASISEKEADNLGYTFKEQSLLDVDNMTADELLDLALTMKEWEEEALKAKPKKGQPSLFEMEDEMDDEEMDATPKAQKGGIDFSEYQTKMDGYMTGVTKKMDMVNKKMDAMYKMLQGMGHATKEAGEDWTEVADIHTLRIAELEDRVAGLTGQLETATKELAELTGNVPQAMRDGIRPTQSADNITGETPQVGVTHKNGQGTSADSFFDFIVGGE